ncbi:DUF1183 domain protein [Rutstroemia sp. NJR-2017a WRK4]|nr:DUF1183 domain protein [Rutstroemia sp. NJR-2017a WRK4]
MQLLPFLYPVFLALLTFTPLSAAKPKDAILLSKVKSLTLRDNAKTSHRRVPAVPQLNCQGPGCRHYKVDIMRCVNQGSDYSSEDIQWSCSANIPEEFKLGSTEVICEGYDSKDDDYVLKGSCAVEYRLLLTTLGEEKYGKSYWDGGSGSGDVEKGLGLLFWVIFIGVVLWILYSMWQNYQQGPNPAGPRRNPGFGGGWGGGGGGGADDPYDPPPPYPGTGKRYTRNSGAADQAWRPGFWSGAAAGAAGGYFAGNRAANRQQNRGNSWGGGGGGSGWGSSSSPSSPGSGSSNTRSSTGFGSTSRR